MRLLTFGKRASSISRSTARSRVIASCLPSIGRTTATALGGGSASRDWHCLRCRKTGGSGWKRFRGGHGIRTEMHGNEDLATSSSFATRRVIAVFQRRTGMQMVTFSALGSHTRGSRVPRCRPSGVSDWKRYWAGCGEPARREASSQLVGIEWTTNDRPPYDPACDCLEQSAIRICEQLAGLESNAGGFGGVALVLARPDPMLAGRPPPAHGLVGQFELGGDNRRASPLASERRNTPISGRFWVPATYGASSMGSHADENGIRSGWPAP
jgi:hypothetical protein